MYVSVQKSWNDDFRAYYQACALLLSGANIYDLNVVEGGFLYSPLFALLMVPVAVLPQIVAASFWFLLNVTSLILSIALALYLTEGTSAPFTTWVKGALAPATTGRQRGFIVALVLVLSARFWLNNIEHGQVNLLLWCIVLLSVLLIRSDRVAIGSALLSLAIIIKVLPFLLLFYYLLRRKYSVVGLSLFWLCLFLLLPAAVLGWQHNLDLLTAWNQRILQPNFGQGAIGVGDSNQSLNAMVIRFLSEIPANEDTGATVNFFSLSLQTVGLLTKFFSFMLLAVIAVLALTKREKTARRENVEVAIVLLTAVLIPSLAWKAYFVAAIMGYTVIVRSITGTEDKRYRHLLIALATASFVLHTLTSDGIWGWKLAHVFQSYSCVTFSMVLLYAALLLTLREPRTARAPVDISKASSGNPAFSLPSRVKDRRSS